MINTTYIKLGTKKERKTLLSGIIIFILFFGMGSNMTVNFAMAQVDNTTNTNTTATTNTTTTINTANTTANTNTTPFPPIENNTSENETAVGQHISDFVHQAVQIFQQQRNETIADIKACHASLANATAADKEQIMDNCKTDLSTINEKYADVRAKYQELFTNFKNNMNVFLNETRGFNVDPNEKKQALDNIMDVRNTMKMEGKMDVLRGISDIMRGHALISLGHPIRGLEAIQNGKYRLGEANMTGNYRMNPNGNMTGGYGMNSGNMMGVRMMHHFGNMTGNYRMNPNGNMTGGYMMHHFGNMTGNYRMNPNGNMTGGYMMHHFGNMTGNYRMNPNGNMTGGYGMNSGNMMGARMMHHLNMALNPFRPKLSHIGG
jgi:hypothetical protein